MKTSTRLALLSVPLAAVAGLPAAPATTPAPTISVILPFDGGDSSTYLASVITAAPSYTAYAVTCGPLSASQTASDIGDFCGPEFTISQGSSLWELRYTVAGVESVSVHCEGNVKAGPLTCVEDLAGPAVTASGEATVTETLVKSDLESAFAYITVTAGAELLTGGSASATPSASAQTSSSKASVTSTGSLSTVTGTATKGAESSGSTTTAKATGAATGTATSASASASAIATHTGAAVSNIVQQGAVIGAAVLAVLAL